MGAKLVKMIEFAEKEGGAMAKARVVMKSGISDSKAAAEPDSTENIEKLKAAIKEVVGKDAPGV